MLPSTSRASSLPLPPFPCCSSSAAALDNPAAPGADGEERQEEEHEEEGERQPLSEIHVEEEDEQQHLQHLQQQEQEEEEGEEEGQGSEHEGTDSGLDMSGFEGASEEEAAAQELPAAASGPGLLPPLAPNLAHQEAAMVQGGSGKVQLASPSCGPSFSSFSAFFFLPHRQRLRHCSVGSSLFSWAVLRLRRSCPSY